MASNDEKRFLIILTALSQMQVGSHYLTGADGAIPGVTGSGLARELTMPEDLTIEHLSIHGARNNFGTVAADGKRFSAASSSPKANTTATCFCPNTWNF